MCSTQVVQCCCRRPKPGNSPPPTPPASAPDWQRPRRAFQPALPAGRPRWRWKKLLCPAPFLAACHGLRPMRSSGVVAPLLASLPSSHHTQCSSASTHCTSYSLPSAPMLQTSHSSATYTSRSLWVTNASSIPAQSTPPSLPPPLLAQSQPHPTRLPSMDSP